MILAIWHEWRCLVGETLLNWAMSVLPYPEKAVLAAAALAYFAELGIKPRSAQ